MFNAGNRTLVKMIANKIAVPVAETKLIFKIAGIELASVTIGVVYA